MQLVTISGRPECIQSAEEAIRSIIDQRLSEKKDRKETRLLIPDHAVGKLIGRRGTNIRSIQRQTGAHVSVEERAGAGGDRICVVSGNSRQIEEALLLIEASVQVNHKESKGSRQGHSSERVHLIPAFLPETNDYFASFVSAVDGEGGVWVQPMEREDPAQLEDLVDRMTLFYGELSDEDSRLENVVVGCVCAAPFEHDGSWYRAVITSAPTQGLANILYVDYGDSGSVAVTKLKTLR